MDVKDLMIGDWMYSPKGELCKVHMIEGRFEAFVTTDNYAHDDGTFYLYSIEEIRPVPLTPEILEKNGFEKTLDEDDMECYRYYNRAADGYIKITLYDGGDGGWRMEIVNYDKFNDNEIRYKNEFSFLKVHKLQHALRLCEIDKTIEL